MVARKTSTAPDACGAKGKCLDRFELTPMGEMLMHGRVLTKSERARNREGGTS